MTATTNNGNEPPPEDEDRSLLFGSSKEGAEPAGDRQRPRRPEASASPPPGTSPPAAGAEAEPPDPAGSEDPADLATALAVLADNQRQILARLEDQSAVLAALAAREAELAAAVQIITEKTDQLGSTVEWVNDMKAATTDLLASTGKQIEGLKSGNKDLDAALAQLIILKEGLDRVVQALDTRAKDLDERSSELGAVKRDLAGYYEAWTDESKTSRREMKALSERLDAGDHMVTRLEGSIGPWTDRMDKSIRVNSDAQLAAAEKTSGNVTLFITTAGQFLRDFAATSAMALRETRRERTRFRRWMVPPLAIALGLAAPSLIVGGAVVQNEYSVIRPFDETLGWKDAVWEHHGKQVRDCMQESVIFRQVIRCSFDVEFL